MNIIFLGLMYCEELMPQLMKKSRTGLQIAPHKFQKNLISGLRISEGVDVSVLNVPIMGSFPINSKSPVSKDYVWENGRNRQVGYLNIPFVKHSIQRRKIKKALERQIKGREKQTSIIIYSLYEPFVDAAQSIKLKYPDVRVCLIQTDAVPGRDDMEKYMTRAAKRRGDRVVRKAKSFDSFAVLTKHLVDPLECGERPFCVVECVCDSSQDPDPRISNEKKVCLYTGSLSWEFGIGELCDAFADLENAELWLCGGGEMSDHVSEMASKYKNIKYFGFVSPDRVAKIRQQANYLINPRRPSGTYTRYSFPSKTAEYMMSGKPVIMYKLEGIPDEYDEYLNYLESDSVMGIKKELQEIFEADYDELCSKASNGRSFMLDRTSPKNQAQKIIDLLERKE